MSSAALVAASRLVAKASCQGNLDRDDAGFIKRHDSDPPPPDPLAAQKLVERWTKQEDTPGYAPSVGTWPPREGQPSREQIPILRAAFDHCGGKDHLREGPRTRECNEVSFKLATALCGVLCGHTSDDQPSEVEQAEGSELMRCLADAGIVEGSCGWAFILHTGDLVEEDVAGAAQYHRQAAQAGYAQSMHEIGTMHYLGDGLPEDMPEAVRWFRRAAECGISSSMYLLGECLLAGEGTPKDVDSAIGWFAAAGELGHRGARSRLISTLGMKHTPDAGQYYAVAALKLSDWMELGTAGGEQQQQRDRMSV